MLDLLAKVESRPGDRPPDATKNSKVSFTCPLHVVELNVEGRGHIGSQAIRADDSSGNIGQSLILEVLLLVSKIQLERVGHALDDGCVIASNLMMSGPFYYKTVEDLGCSAIVSDDLNLHWLPEPALHRDSSGP